MEAHPYARRLTTDEYRLVEDLTRKNVEARNILAILKEQNKDNVSTIKDIYNAQSKIRKAQKVEETTMQVKKIILEARQRQYKYVFETIGYKKIYNAVKFAGRWMEMPDTGLVIASAYKKVVVNLSDAGGCNTSFPLWSRPSQSDSHETIVVARVNANHYIRVALREGFSLPLTHPFWITYRSDIASGWEDKFIGGDGAVERWWSNRAVVVEQSSDGGAVERWWSSRTVVMEQSNGDDVAGIWSSRAVVVERSSCGGVAEIWK
uniref:Protein FAR1-related sequence 5-like n=1 Tax=Tanacetum cinerariifolium TaxID=118510 RepID=A0A6L2LZP2_TANCI|nr:protein FAR1-related sequence 5-like [Tanacetum cinerariifolium]